MKKYRTGTPARFARIEKGIHAQPPFKYPCWARRAQQGLSSGSIHLCSKMFIAVDECTGSQVGLNQHDTPVPPDRQHPNRVQTRQPDG